MIMWILVVIAFWIGVVVGGHARDWGPEETASADHRD